jgi:hypothetical protein
MRLKISLTLPAAAKFARGIDDSVSSHENFSLHQAGSTDVTFGRQFGVPVSYAASNIEALVQFLRREMPRADQTTESFIQECHTIGRSVDDHPHAVRAIQGWQQDILSKRLATPWPIVPIIQCPSEILGDTDDSQVSSGVIHGFK